MRKILVTHRTVPLDRSDEYAAAWQRLAATAATHAAQTWLFHRAGHEDRFVEFLEWGAPSSLLDEADVEEALRDLEEIAVGTCEELEEARP